MNISSVLRQFFVPHLLLAMRSYFKNISNSVRGITQVYFLFLTIHNNKLSAYLQYHILLDDCIIAFSAT